MRDECEENLVIFDDEGRTKRYRSEAERQVDEYLYLCDKIRRAFRGR